MPLTLSTSHGNLCFYTGAAVDDRRGELVRMRLTEEDLEKATAIQDYLESIGQYASLGKVVGSALDAYFSTLVAAGAVSPNP